MYVLQILVQFAIQTFHYRNFDILETNNSICRSSVCVGTDIIQNIWNIKVKCKVFIIEQRVLAIIYVWSK